MNGFGIHNFGARDFPQSFADCKAMASTRRRKLAGNTYLDANLGADVFGIRFHATTVVAFREDGAIMLDTGGWQTSTTRDRMRRAGIRIYTEGGVPEVAWCERDYVYRDGMVLHPDGRVEGHGGDDPAAARRARRKLLRTDPHAERLHRQSNVLADGCPDLGEYDWRH